MRCAAALAAVAGILFVAACQDTSTAPVMSAPTQSPLLGGISGDNPPPPPIDSGAVGTASGSTTTFQLSFNVTYFFNKPENSGWLKFKKDQFDTNVDIDNSAAIRLTNGVFSGRGTIMIIGPDRTLSIDLSKVTSDGSSFGECSITPTTTDGTRTGCYNVAITGATFMTKDGATEPATVFLRAAPAKTCDITADACIIVPGT